MTDEKPKSAWTRCPTCSTVMPNIQIAKDGHKLNCPHEMQLKIQGLEKRIVELEKAPEVEVEDPGVDFSGVADWDEDDEESLPAEPDVRPVDSAYSSLPVADGWDDDEESLGSTPIVR